MEPRGGEHKVYFMTFENYEKNNFIKYNLIQNHVNFFQGYFPAGSSLKLKVKKLTPYTSD